MGPPFAVAPRFISPWGTGTTGPNSRSRGATCAPLPTWRAMKQGSWAATSTLCI